MTQRGRTSRGRRPGAPDTRAEILGAARTLFAARGFAGTTIRAIGTEAGVDPALVHHYFGSKDDLFLASLQLPIDPREVLAPVLAAGPEAAGEHLLEAILEVWDDPAHQPVLLTLVRTLLDPTGTTLLSQGFVPLVLGPVGQALARDRPEERVPLVVSQILGLLVSRYVLRLEPLASMDRRRVVATYAPTLQRYLGGELPG